MKTCILLLACLVQTSDLINQLGDESHLKRDEAQQALIQQGDSVLPEIEKAINSDDPEIKLRAKLIYNKIVDSHYWEGTQIKLSKKRLQLLQVCKELSDQMRMMIGPENVTQFHDKEVVVQNDIFWNVIQTVNDNCDASFGLYFKPTFMSVNNDAENRPTAIDGAVRATLTTIRRDLYESKSYGRPGSELRHSLNLEMNLDWEPKIRMIGYLEPTIIQVQDSEGRDLPITANGHDWLRIPSDTVSLCKNVKLPPTYSSSLKLLKIKYTLAAATDYRNYKMPFGDTLEKDLLKIELSEPEYSSIGMLIIRAKIVIDGVLAFDDFKMGQLVIGFVNDKGEDVSTTLKKDAMGWSIETHISYKPVAVRISCPTRFLQKDVVFTFENVELPDAFLKGRDD